MAELQEQVTGKDTEAAELRNQIDDLQYELQKVTQRNDKLETSLADAIEQLKTYQQLHAQADDKAQDKKPVNVVTNSVSHKKVSFIALKCHFLYRFFQTRFGSPSKLGYFILCPRHENFICRWRIYRKNWKSSANWRTTGCKN